MQLKSKIIIKKSFRKTISLSIENDGVVLVRAPSFLTKAQIEKFIKEKDQWLRKSLKKIKERKEKAQRFNELIDPNKIKDYRERARTLLTDRTDYFAEKYNLDYSRLRISSAKTRWGSCNHQNGLNLNWKILFAPPQVQDYLVAHELAHTVHRNHQQKFWRLVENMHPQYKESRRWLKQNSHLL
jgi:predicted metal-dependent hydrolase